MKIETCFGSIEFYPDFYAAKTTFRNIVATF